MVNTQETVVKEKEILGIRGSTRQNLRDCVRLVEQGVLKPYVYKKYPLEQINEALSELETLTNVGRITIRF
jgi:Zn-dependent alcohol dehydrogenases